MSTTVPDKPHPDTSGGDPITAFVLEMDTPGIEIPHRSRFMGLKALYNCVLRFTDVRIPVENRLGDERRGLKIALTTLNSGRLSIPASCVGIAKHCPKLSREWASTRVQWGAPIGRHDAIATELSALSAACSHADSLLRSGSAPANVAEILDDVARLARERIDSLFTAIQRNSDTEGYALAQRVLDGEYAWLEDGPL